MSQSRRSLRFYWVAVAVYALLWSWWVVFFFRQGDILVQRIEESGSALNPAQAEAVRDATHATLRMFVFEGGFIALLLLAGVFLVVRSLRREIEVNEQQRNFLSAVTHELRSPLASARLYIESLQLGRAQGDKAQRYLKHAHEDLERLRRLVEEMLASARASAGRLELATEEVDLGVLVSGRIEHARRTPGVDADVNQTLAAGVIALGDPTALEKIVDNLLSNALKYGGPEPRVAVEVYALNGSAIVDVRDFGPGLGGVDPVSIFEPFVRGGDEDVRREPGVGLGLYLVGQLVDAQDGQVSARDGLDGGGTLFRVELPLEEVRR